jgi:cytochrome c oxidase assembly factor CtaG
MNCHFLGMSCHQNPSVTKAPLLIKELHLAMLVHWSDTNLPRLLRFLEPVMRWLKQLAVRKGIDQALIQQYVRI